MRSCQPADRSDGLSLPFKTGVRDTDSKSVSTSPPLTDEFPGQIDLGRRRLDVVVAVRQDTVSLRSGDHELGRWPAGDFRVEKRADGSYDLGVDGEQYLFYPHRTNSLALTLDGLAEEQSGDEPAEVEATEAETPEITLEDEMPLPSESALEQAPTEKQNRRQWLIVGVGATLVAGLAVAMGFALAGLSGRTAAREVPSVASVPPTAQAPPVTAPSTTTTTVTVPASPGAGFVASWNALAATYAPGLAVEGDTLPLDTDLTPVLRLRAEPSGALLITAAPSGEPSDREILIAFGMAVAWAEPELEPDGRARVLETLGIDVDQPNLLSVGAETQRSGLTYRAEVAEGIVRFSIEPGATPSSP